MKGQLGDERGGNGRTNLAMFEAREFDIDILGWMCRNCRVSHPGGRCQDA